MIDLVLGLAVDDERDRLAELKDRSAVERHELLAIQLECHRQHRSLGSSGGSRGVLVVARDAADLGIAKDRHVKPRRVFGLMIEPQTRRDSLNRLRHGFLGTRRPPRRPSRERP
jgi:hypothetical protein